MRKSTDEQLTAKITERQIAERVNLLSILLAYGFSLSQIEKVIVMRDGAR